MIEEYQNNAESSVIDVSEIRTVPAEKQKKNKTISNYFCCTVK